MRKILLLTVGLMLCLNVSAQALTFGAANYLENMSWIGSGDKDMDPIYLFINDVENTLDGTTGVDLILFTPGTEPAATEGTVYYDAAGNNLKLRTNLAWVDIDVSGASSLNTAYGVGSKILAPTLEVEIEVADSSNNPALRLDFDDATSNAQDVFIIDNAGDDADAVSIQINGTAGDDIRGTSDSWSISYLGAIDVIAIDVTGDITLENDELIKNDNNGEIEFGNGTEDTAFSWTANSLDLSSDTGVVEIDFGALDSLVGLNALAFDVAVANTITQAGTGAADDLTIQQTASGVDASLILQSTGTSTSDALSLISSVGSTKINSADNLDIDAADDITVDTADGGYTLTIAGATNGDFTATVADVYSLIVVDTITIQNTEATKDITINSVLGSIAIEAEEDVANAVLITADGGTSSTMRLHNDTGNTATSIEFLTDLGGITGTASAGPVLFTATGATAGDMTLTVGDDYKLLVTGEAFNGIDGTGFDTTWYGATASSNMKWDENGDTNGSLIITGGSQTITGIDSGGNLLTITGIDTTGNSDTAVIAHSGTGDGLQITATEADSVAANFIAATSQTTSLVKVDGSTGSWLGAANVGMIHVTNDGALADVASSLLYINNTGIPTNDSRGSSLRIVDTGNAAAGTAGYAVYISATDATVEALYVDDGNVLIDDNLEIGGTTTFTGGQTRSIIFEMTDVELDSSKPPGTTSIGTSEQAEFDTLGFDANPDATGDDSVFISWVVPAGYIADSADLHVYWSHSNAEDAADEIVIDGTVNAIAPGEALDAAGTVMAAVTSVIADASASAGTLVKTSLDIEVETITVGDMVLIWFFVDESASLMTVSGTADVHYFEITYESSE